MRVVTTISRSRIASTFCFIALVGILLLIGREIVRQVATASSPEVVHTPPRLRPAAKGKSLKRNLLLQPEAAKMMARVGNRFNGFTNGVSVLSGTLDVGGNRESIQITRRQSDEKEQVDVATSGASLKWDDLAGFKEAGAVPEATREAVERVISDSVDRFILSQLRGAAYTVVSRNVRADNTGSENYEGPLWTVVRGRHRVTFTPNVHSLQLHL